MFPCGPRARLCLAGLIVLVLALTAASAGAAVPDCGAPVDNGSAAQVTCSFTGGEQAFAVPSGVTSVHVEATGASGGGSIGAWGSDQCGSFTAGGLGARVTGDLAVTGGTTYYVEVGGQGSSYNCSFPSPAGGFNGGGNPGVRSYGHDGAGGGGASDVRTCSTQAGCSGLGTASDPRLLVAGGGGGCGTHCDPSSATGGAAGTPTPGGAGGNGWAWALSDEPGGGGGATDTAGGGGGGPLNDYYSGHTAAAGEDGSAGQGGSGGSGPDTGAGGGGGYFGGGGGGAVDTMAAEQPVASGGGGGGSSHVATSITNATYGAATGGNGSVVITYISAPVCSDVAKTVANETATAVALTCVNHDAGGQQFSVVDDPSHGSLSALNASTGTVTYTPHAGYMGSDSFTYRSTNAVGDSSTVTATLTVSPPAVPPCRNVAARTAFATAVSVTLDCSQVSGYANTFSTVTNPSDGDVSALDAAAGTLTYTPQDGFAGDATFTYRATNAGGDSVTKTVTVTVDPPAPTCSAVSAVTRASTAQTVALRCTGRNGYPLTYAAIGQPAYGSLSNLDATAGTVDYTPDDGFTGTDTFTYRATNSGGGSAPATASLLTDGTKPTIAITAPGDEASFDQGAVVTAGFACADESGGSGLHGCIGTTADGTAIDTSTYGSHDLTVTATDVAGNQRTATATYFVNDVTAPSATITAPVDGGSYDRGDVVSAAYSCTDQAGGSGVAGCAGAVASGSAIDTSTAGMHSFKLDVSDAAGNQRTITASYRVLDKTPPTLDIHAPAAGGIYRRGTSYAASYSCSDEAGGSALASCGGTTVSGAAFDTDTLGEHSYTVHGADSDGNVTTRTVSYEVRDSTAPSVTILSPADDARIPRGAAVAIHYRCADEAGGSGIDSCTAPLADGALLDTSRLGRFTVTVDGVDNAGNAGRDTIHYTVADVTAPAITIRRPSPGQVIDAGATVRAAYSCTDDSGDSAVVACSGDVASGGRLPTAEPGLHDLTVRSVDSAGNAVTRVVHYRVRPARVRLGNVSVHAQAGAFAPLVRVDLSLSRRAQVTAQLRRVGGHGERVVRQMFSAGRHTVILRADGRGLPFRAGAWRLTISARDSGHEATPARVLTFRVSAHAARRATAR